jgi:hypothetical protein
MNTQFIKTDYPLHSLLDTKKIVSLFANKYKYDMVKFKHFTIPQMFKFIACKIHYVEDPTGVEFIQRPAVLLHRGEGDCDCKTVMFLSYLILKNIKCGFSITRDFGKKRLHHIYPFLIKNNKIINLNPTYYKNKIINHKKWAERQNTIVYKGN